MGTLVSSFYRGNYRGLGLLIDPRSAGSVLNQTPLVATGAQPRVVMNQLVPALQVAPVVATGIGEEYDYRIPTWFEANKSKLAIGAGALVALSIAYTLMKKKSSVAGYRRRSRR